MLARITPGVVPPAIGTPTISRIADANEWENLVNYSYNLNATVTVTASAPLPSAGFRAYVKAGPAANNTTLIASSLVPLVSGVNTLAIPITLLNKTYYYRLYIALADSFGNISYDVANSSAVQLPDLLWYRIRYFDTGLFTFDTTKSKCDIIMVSGGGVSGTDLLGQNGGGGFGVKFEGLAPPSGTFYHDLTKASGGPVYLRRDSAVSTSNEITGTNGNNWNTTAPGGEVATLTGIFASPDYAVDGSDNLAFSGARIQGDLLYADPPIFDDEGNELTRYWGDGGLSRGAEALDPPVGQEGTIQVLYYE